MATLTIAHYIYLTKTQRYQLHKKESIDVIGVNLPVWFHKGTTSEPAQEIFCKYRISNDDSNKIITQEKDGYSINLPQEEKINSERLLDVPDGGSAYLEFKQYGKIHKESKSFNIVHFIEIQPLELLEDTLC